MNDEKIVVYQTYIDPNQAYIIRGLLESYGINCFLSDENMVTLNAMYSSAVGGVKLNVFEKDVYRISSILDSENKIQESAQEIETNNVRCPICYSSNVAFGGSVNQKFGLSIALLFSLITSFLMMIYPFKMRKVHHCFECGHEFRKTKTNHSDIH